MPFEEKVTWVSLVVTVVVPVAYFAIMLGRLGDVSAAEIAYQRPLLIAIGASIVLTIVGSILTGIGTGISAELRGRSASGDIDRKDERDKQHQPARRPDRLLRLVRRRGRRARADDAGVRVLLDRQRALPVVRGRDARLVGGQARRLPQGLLAMGKPTRVTNSIRALRFAAGEMTQAELADKVGVTRQTVIAIEQGRYSPSLEMAFQIARVFGVPLDDVFQYPEVKSMNVDPSAPARRHRAHRRPRPAAASRPRRRRARHRAVGRAAPGGRRGRPEADGGRGRPALA